MQRKSGYDCPNLDCGFHCDDVVTITRHVGDHKAPVTARPDPRWAAVRDGDVIARGDDLTALVTENPGAHFGMVG
jgi:hypothetical protein